MNAERLFVNAISEVKRARTKFPSPNHLTLAFAEESGEVIKAILDFKHGKGYIEDVQKEMVQAMAMLIRLAEEGDPTVELPGDKITDKNR